MVLFDIPQKEGFAKGKALDLEQASALSGSDAKVLGSSNWSDVAGADVLIITAGIPRKPGQSRDDLVAVNVPIIRSVAAGGSHGTPCSRMDFSTVSPVSSSACSVARGLDRSGRDNRYGRS